MRAGEAAAAHPSDLEHLRFAMHKQATVADVRHDQQPVDEHNRERRASATIALFRGTCLHNTHTHTTVAHANKITKEQNENEHQRNTNTHTKTQDKTDKKAQQQPQHQKGAFAHQKATVDSCVSTLDCRNWVIAELAVAR